MEQQALELVSLAEVIAAGPAGHVLVPGFAARLSGPLVGGEVVSEGAVTAVLERTAVVALADGERGLARIPEVLVDPAAVTWRRQGPSRLGKPWAGREPGAEVAEELVTQRNATDERARRSQELAARGAGHQVGSDRADADGGQPPDGRPACQRCGGRLRPHNTRGVCTACQGTCPSCGGLKAPQAERCRACRWEQPPGSATDADVATASEPSPTEGEGLADEESLASPGTPDEASPGDVDRRDDVAPTRRCGVCGGELPRHNRKGVCTACQGTCPSCGGPKAVQAERCRACRREDPPGPATEAMRFADALRDLPDCVQELLDQVVTLARYARDLEDELAGYRAAERGVRPW